MLPSYEVPPYSKRSWSPRPPGLHTCCSLALAHSHTFSPLRECPSFLKLSCHGMEVPLVPQRQCPHSWSPHHILPEAGPSMLSMSLKGPPHHQTRDLGGIQEVPSPSAFTPHRMPSAKNSCSCSIKPSQAPLPPFLTTTKEAKGPYSHCPLPILAPSTHPHCGQPELS